MALNTLKDVKSIGGFEIKRVEWAQPEKNFIEINDKHNAITFKLQNGPIIENGVNGCQVDTIIETALCILVGLNSQFSCLENAQAIHKLDEALVCLEKRRKDRLKRNVEGKNEN